jgi:hypothetical protein
MYEFAVVALLGLVALKVTDLMVELVPGIDRVRTLATFIVALASVLVLDYSVFQGFGLTVSEEWAGTLLTGLIAGALAFAWDAVFGWLGGSTIATEGRRNDRPRIAA